MLFKDVMVSIGHRESRENPDAEQLADIMSGKIANWKTVGGPDERIMVIVPPRSSGTRKFLEETVMNGADFTASAFTAVTTREEIDLVAQSPIAIGGLCRKGSSR